MGWNGKGWGGMEKDGVEWKRMGGEMKEDGVEWK